MKEEKPRLSTDFDYIIAPQTAYGKELREIASKPSKLKGNSCGAKNRRKRLNKITRIRKRDGKNCFYCGLKLAMGDVTIEHLEAKGNGGSNNIENLRIAHKECNGKARDLPVDKKLLLRAK